MTDSTFDTHGVAFAGVSLFGNKPRGPRPDWLEIEAWQNRTMHAERAAEVLSHIANDPECYQQWLDLCEALEWSESQVESGTEHTSASVLKAELEQDELQTDPHPPDDIQVVGWFTTAMQRLSEWLKVPPPALGGAFAAVVLTLLIVPLFQSDSTPGLTDQLEQQWQRYATDSPGGTVAPPLINSTRSLGGVLGKYSDDAVEQHWLRRGMLDGNSTLILEDDEKWTAWRNDLSDPEFECAKSDTPDRCQRLEAELKPLGRWVFMNFHACAQPVTQINDEFWAIQLVSFGTVMASSVVSQSGLLSEYSRSQMPASRDELCAAVDDLIKIVQ